MPNINQLQNVNIRDLVNKPQSSQTAEPKVEAGQKDFGETIADFVDAVNNAQKDSSKATADIIHGKSDNLHQAMATMGHL